MAHTHHNYDEQLAAELQQVPDEYMPALIDIIHAFRSGVIQKNFEEELKASLRDAKAGKTYPIDNLWDDIEH